MKTVIRLKQEGVYLENLRVRQRLPRATDLECSLRVVSMMRVSIITSLRIQMRLLALTLKLGE